MENMEDITPKYGPDFFHFKHTNRKNFMFPGHKVGNTYDRQIWMLLLIVIFCYTYLSQKLEARASYNWPIVGTGI